MKKRPMLLLVLIIIVLLIYIINPKEISVFNKRSSTSDITDTVSINSKKLKVTYYKGNLIDEKIQYG